MHRCSDCKKPEGQVEFASRRGGKLQSLCRDCQSKYSKNHYSVNKTKHNQNRYKRRKEERKRIRELLISAKSKPCADCGVSYPFWVMQFDHVDGKKALNLSEFSRKGWSEEKLKEELVKCEVVCANCHADRTYKRSHPSVAQHG